MSKPYTVQPGDTLTGIAAREGYASWRDIYYDPENTAFRAKRPNPNHIMPGDVLILPGKADDPPAPPNGAGFALFLLRDSSDPRQAKAIIAPAGPVVRDSATYRFEPRSFAEGMARKLGRRDVRSAEFQTPEPMTTRSFNGILWLVQLI